MRSRDQFGEVKASWWATGVFTVTAFGADFVSFVRGPAAVVAIVLFVGGIVAMGAALVIAAGRSREVVIGIGGLFFLSDAAPKAVQRHLMGSLALQIAVGLVTAALRPYTSSALGVLVPLAGLGLAGLWCARHGEFPERVVA
ncbi:MAG: hypothetical protein Q8K63_03720 [Acidimicrobiales bacterium]|nr:hypothetical protein [Acidimicrobiales bacterium]